MQIQLKSQNGATLLTNGKYCAEDIEVIPALQEKTVDATTTSQTVSPDENYAGLSSVTVNAIQTQTKSTTPSASAQTISADAGKYLTSVTVAATPLDPAQEVTAGTADVSVTPTEGNIGLASVTVHPTPTETKTIDANGTFTPSAGKYFSSVTVNVNTAKPEQEKSVELTTMDSVEVTPDDGYTLSKVTVTPAAPLADTSDATATAADILTGITAYVNGTKITGAIVKQTKSAIPSTAAQTITPDAGNLLSSVTVAATPLDAAQTVTAGTAAKTVAPTAGKIGLASITINPTPSSSKTATPTKDEQTISPEAGQLLSSVTVNPIPDEYIVPTGSQTITANGTVDVAALASVVVAVPDPDLSDATATTVRILSGYTAYTGDGKITGTIPTYDGSIREN